MIRRPPRSTRAQYRRQRQMCIRDSKRSQLEEIAKTKMQDLNAASLEAAVSMIAGTARSMGVTVED